MRLLRKAQLSLGLLALLPIGVILFGLGNELKLREIRSHGEVVQGVVLGGGERPGGSGRLTHYLLVEFMVADEGRQVRRFPVDEDDYLQANQAGVIQVTFIASDPGFTRVGTSLGYNRQPLYWAALALAVMVLAIAALGLLAARRRGGRLLIRT